MKRSLLLLILLLPALSGCMSPNFSRLVPENKDADILVVYPYGQIIIRSRVNPSGTNVLAPLNNNQPILTP